MIYPFCNFCIDQHLERISFHLIHFAEFQLMLGFCWLTQHNSQFNCTLCKDGIRTKPQPVYRTTFFTKLEIPASLSEITESLGISLWSSTSPEPLVSSLASFA